MKTEIQIAEENLEQINDNIKIAGEFFDGRDMLRHGCFTHKASCQRFLEFLEGEIEKWKSVGNINPDIYISTGELEEKIQDLKQVIKLYDEAGI